MINVYAAICVELCFDGKADFRIILQAKRSSLSVQAEGVASVQAKVLIKRYVPMHNILSTSA